MPDWLTTFELADWYDGDEPVPLAGRANLGEAPYRCLRAYERWRQAGLDWLAEADRDASPAGWRRVVWPGDWSTDPRSIAKRVRHAA